MEEQENSKIGVTAITDAPANVTAGTIDTSNIQITWDMVTDAAGYYVFRGVTENGLYAQVGDTPNTWFTDTHLAPNTTYYYKVAAYNGDDTGPLSASVRATTASAPDAPQNLRAEAAGPIQINTVWDSVNGAERYNVYRSTSPSGPYELVGLTASPSYIDVGLTPNTVYYYLVTAIAEGEESAHSNVASAVTAPDIPMPANVTATAVSPTQINTAWDTLLNATAYMVYRSTTPDGTYQYVGTTNDSVYSDMGLMPNTTYYYKVSAIVGGVEGSPSAYAAATTFPVLPVPQAPENVRAQVLSCTEILVTWDLSTGAEGYQVYRSKTADGPYQLVGITTTVPYIDTGLSPCTTYYYFVQAYTAGQFSAQSTRVSAVTPSCGAPVPPCQNCCCPRCGCHPCCCHGPHSTPRSCK